MKNLIGTRSPLGWLVLAGLVGGCTADAEPGVSAETDAGVGGSGGAATSATGGRAGTAGGGTAGGAVNDARSVEDATAPDGGGSDSAVDAKNAVDASSPGDAIVDAATEGPIGVKIIGSTGVWVVFSEPYGDGGRPNPITTSIMGVAEAFELPAGMMRITVKMTGLPANGLFECRLHKLMCDDADQDAGGDYQNRRFPRDGSAVDPAFANSTNEAWMDFTTDATGAGFAETIVGWIPRPDEANSIIIHDGVVDAAIPGAPLACTNLPF